MVNMHIILKGKKDDIAVRYYEDDIINLRLFPYTTINKFYFKEVE